MKARIKFAKRGNLKYIGHLDVMRFFQRMMRRSGVPIKYSEGFSPHQIMSFAAPLGIGLESEAEYLDLELVDGSEQDGPKYRDMLNAVCCDGLEIINFVVLPDDAKKGMSLVDAADYSLYFDEFSARKEGLIADIEAMRQVKELVVDKLIKKSGEIQKTDIKPLIYELSVEDDHIHMCISQGSENNLRPEYVARILDIENYHIIRTEIYSKGHIALDSID